MILVQGDHARFFSSPDLKDWLSVGEFGSGHGSQQGIWECPDLFPLPVENRPGEIKWVILISLTSSAPNGGTGTQYFVGDFDGQTFTNHHSPDTVLWLDHGRDNYAAVTYADIPPEDGRRLLIGWMSNWQYARLTPTSPWRSAMTVPRELSLLALPSGEYRLISRPVAELTQLRGDHIALDARSITTATPMTAVESLIQSGVFEAELYFEPGTASEFGLHLSSDAGDEVWLGYQPAARQLFIDRRQSGRVDFSEVFPSLDSAPLDLLDDQLQLRFFLDRSSIEIFANDGQVVLTDQIFPTRPLNRLELYAKAGEAHLRHGTIWALTSIWGKAAGS
jgi:fructan beta-fructosidase